jgi:hypothetical protein
MDRLQKITCALLYLKAARDQLRAANAPRAYQRVRLAISSAKGAARHAHGDPYRAARKESRERKG